MVELENQIKSVKAERSLLMSYCTSLSFFEREILPHLQQAGAGRVTMLIDENEYQESFVDFATGVGVRYRLCPVRLPISAKRFHPKLYLLMTPKMAKLLVASANLTPSGIRGNAEIVDQLTLSGLRRSPRTTQ
jgi:hypothetical protein